MGDLGIIVAMRKEFDSLFPDYAGDFYVEYVGHGRKVIAVTSGIGKVNAASTAYHLCCDRRCTQLLSLGCAGAAKSSVKVGDVIISDRCAYHDVWHGKPNKIGQVQGEGLFYPSQWDLWLPLLEACFENISRLHIGGILTGDRFIENKKEAERIAKISPDIFPLAFDTESAAIAQVCAEHSIGFTSIRTISDNVFHKKQGVEYLSFWKKADDYFKPTRQFISML